MWKFLDISSVATHLDLVLLGQLRVPRLLPRLLGQLVHGLALLLHRGPHLLGLLGVVLYFNTQNNVAKSQSQSQCSGHLVEHRNPLAPGVQLGLHGRGEAVSKHAAIRGDG